MAAAPKVREYIRKIRDEIRAIFGTGGFGMQPALAYASAKGNFAAIKPLMDEKPLTEHTLKFDVAKFPDKGTPSRGIAEWEMLDVLYPNEITDANKGGKRFINMKEAQKEVRRILSAPAACHEYIAYEAAKLSGDDSAIRYTLHIMVGAGSEDYIFMPSETLDDLFVKKPSKKYKNIEEYARSMVPLNERESETPSLLKSLLWLAAKVMKKLTNSIDDDFINRPYMAHFYDNSRAPDDRGLNVEKGEIKFQSALDRLKAYWKLGTNYYQKDERTKAYVALGHMVHLISDLHVPAHVHNDIHGPTRFLGRLDSLEQWTKKADYPHIQRGEGSMNIKIWDSSPLAPPVPDLTWEENNINEKIDSFVNDIVTKTRQFKSVDAPGDAPGQKIYGEKLNDDECYNQAAFLVPAAIFNSAQFIVNFISYQKRLAEKKAALEPMPCTANRPINKGPS